MTTDLRKLGIWLVAIVAIVLMLSVFANVSYYWSICALAAWAAVGHLVTLDDDQPGGWSNPESDGSLWRSSLRELAAR